MVLAFGPHLNGNVCIDCPVLAAQVYSGCCHIDVFLVLMSSDGEEL